MALTKAGLHSRLLLALVSWKPMTGVNSESVPLWRPLAMSACTSEGQGTQLASATASAPPQDSAHDRAQQHKCPIQFS